MRRFDPPRRNIQGRDMAVSMIKDDRFNRLCIIENGREDEQVRLASRQLLVLVLWGDAHLARCAHMFDAPRNALIVAALISDQQPTVNKVQNRP
jgi:hypothetical protein